MGGGLSVYSVRIPSDLLFSTICGQILLVACGQIFSDILKRLLVFFEVSLPSDSRNDTAQRVTALPIPPE